MSFTDSVKTRFGITDQKAHVLFSRYSWLLVLALVLLFALFLRLILYTGVLDSDTLEYAYYAFGASHGDFQFTLVPRDIQFRFALYLPLALLYFVFGVSEFSTVIYVLLASLFGIVFIYGIARLQANESAAIVSALIWATLPLNVFLSTRFGPDEILASFTIGSVFFLLWGNKLRGKKAFYCYLLGLSFAVLGVFVKPSAVIIFAFIGLFFVYKAFRHWREPIGKQIREIRPSVIKGFAVIGGILILILGFWYLQSQLQPFLMSFYRASMDLSKLFVLGSTQEDVHGQWILSTDLFLVAAPMFIVAFAGSLTKRLPGSSLPLLWAASVFLVFEWGTRSTNPAVYTPFQTVVNDRNTLFIFAPFVVLVGIFFAQWLSASQARWLAMLSLVLVLPIALLQNQSHFAGFPKDLLPLIVMVAVIGTLAVLTYLQTKSAKYKPVLLIAWLSATLIAFLYPTPPNHISAEFWQSQIGYRRVIREAVEFFLDHPDYPILTLSGGNARELNFLSSFELGYSVYGVEQPGARIQLASDPKAWTGSAYIYLRDEINQIQPVPSDWWKMAEYDPGSGRPVLIYRHLSATDAADELESARHAVAENQTVASLERLLAAGANAADAQATVTAWIRLNRMSPGDYPLSLLSPTLLDAYSTNELPLGENLLTPSLVGDLDTYQVDPQLHNSVNFEIAGSEPTLSIRMRDYPGGRPGIYKQILLEPDSVYIFSLEVRSTVGVDLLRIMGGEIPDTHDYSDVYGQWEQPLIVFVTPSWEDSMSVRLDLFTVAKPGFVEIRNPSLFKVKIVQP